MNIELQGKPLTKEERMFYQKAMGFNLDRSVIEKLIYYQQLGIVNLNGLFTPQAH